MAVREDVSSDLDFLAGKVPGTIIVRGPSLWEALIPSPAGLVFTSNGPGNAPTWQAVAAGTGTFMVTNSPSTVTTTGAFATKGNPFKFTSEITIRSIGTRLTAVAAHTYRGSVYEIDGAGNIAAILGQTAPITGLAPGNQAIFAALATPASIFPGIHYLIAWSRTDGADNFAGPFVGSLRPNWFPGLPEDFYSLTTNDENFTQIAKANPQVGDAAPVTINGRFHGKYEISL